MTKLLFVQTHVPPAMGWGGAMRSATATAQVMDRAGVDLTLVASDGNAAGPAVSMRDAQRVTGLNCKLYQTKHAKGFGFGWAAVPLIIREVLRARCIYISGVFTWPTTLAGLTARLCRKSYAVCPHGGLLLQHLEELRAHKPLRYIYYRVLVKPLIHASTIVRVSSTFEKRDLLASFPDINSVVIPNAFDVSNIPYCEEVQGRLGRHFIYVGRLEQDKGVLKFLELWRSAAGAADQLSIVGSGEGPYADDVMALAKTDARVRLRGELGRAAVYQALAHADILVLPSGLDGTLRENFGNVVVEALSVGRPALVCRGLAWDHLEAEGLGLVFRSDEGAVREAIRRVSTEDWIVAPSTRIRCRKYAEQHYDLIAVRAQVEALAHDMLAIGRSGHENSWRTR